MHKKATSKVGKLIKRGIAADRRIRKKATAMEAKMPVKIRPAAGSLRSTELTRHANMLKGVASRRAGSISKGAARGFGRAADAAIRKARKLR